MLILLLPLSWLLIFVNFNFLFNKRKKDYPELEAVLIASIFWLLILVFVTELLSLFNSLNTFSVGIAWLLISLSSILLLLINRRRGFKSTFNFSFYKDLNNFYKLLAILLVFILAVTFILGLIFPPNNPDAMAYHLARVMHWIQNQSVAFYPTHILRQDVYPPGAEYIALHVLLLTRYDSFVNLIQWFSMIGSLVAVYLMARLIGVGRKGQFLAVLFAATLPIGVLESNSAQNDYVAAFWFITFVYFFSKALLKNYSFTTIFLGAAALGLSIFTKSSTYFFGAAFLIVFFFMLLKKNVKQTFLYFGLTLLIVLLINAPFYIRNLLLFGKPLGEISSINVANTDLSFSRTIINIFSEFMYQLFSPLKFLNVIIKLVYYFIVSSIFSGNFSNPTIKDFMGLGFFINDDSMVNTLHFLAIIGILFYMIFTFGKKIFLKLYFLAAGLGFLFLNFFIVWTNFNTRYYISLFLALSPLAGLCLEKIIDRKFTKIYFISIISVAFFYLIFNQDNSLFKKFDREQEYFSGYSDPLYVVSNKKLADEIKKRNYRNIGLNFEEFYFEYPLWVYLKDRGVKDFRIEHVDVRNKTSEAKMSQFKPDVVIMCDSCFKDAPKYYAIYSKWANVRIKVTYFTLYGK